ncbi:MAG TPA: Nramp family divalent metal transporter [Rubrobacter sp.]|nr:Nramp family divalent metal transporter [Rubrobacter sp.]
MTESVSHKASADGWNEPTKNLPPLEPREMPEPLPLRKLIGASVILLATALGSGELLIWPYITTQAGVGLLWLATVGFMSQYFLNMEIERYTLATGETAVTGFSRFWKPWGIVFALGAILPNAFPGWAASAATSLTFLTGWGESTIPWLVTILLLSIGLAITVSPVVYNTIERVEMVLVVIIVAFLGVAIVIATDLSAWTGIVTEAPEGITNMPGYISEIGIATILGAIAFAGAGGANNLSQSNYIRDKGMGMGVHIPRIVSPITGEEEARPSTGYSWEVNEENMRRWNGWWKVANREQLLTFVVIGLGTLIGLSVLVASVLGEGDYGDPGSIDFLKEEAKVLGEQFGLWFEIFFYIAGFAILFSTNIGIVDYVSRLTADSLKTGYLAESQFWSESKVYFVVAWIMCIGGSVIIWSGIEPLFLLVIASSGGGVVMFLYSGMLIWLNRRLLPEPIRIKGARLIVVALTFAMFAVLSTYLVYYYVNAALTGQL